MSAKSGRRMTGRKPEDDRRKSAKTDGAFGKEQIDRVISGESDRNVDKAVRRAILRQP